MAGRCSIAMATLSGLADAFLLPPSMSATSDPSDISSWSLVDPNSHLLLVPCQGCKVDGSGDSNLLLNLTVGANPGTIELGGEIVYPLNAIPDQSSNPSVLEIPSSVSLADVRSDRSKFDQNANVLTGWMLGTSSETVSEDGNEILSVSLDITSIGSQHVTVPHVDFKLLKNSEDHMMILSSTVAELGQPGMLQCNTLLCRFHQLIQNRLHGITAAFPKSAKGCMKGMKGVPKMLPTHGAGMHAQHEDGPDGEHHGHRHIKLHKIVHHAFKIFMAVAVPILIGIAAGVITYALGMLLGCGVALLWFKFRRGGRRGYDVIAANDEHYAKAMDAKAAYAEHVEEGLPVYEDAPAYEEKEAVV